jgi:hypothetical protein
MDTPNINRTRCGISGRLTPFLGSPKQHCWCCIDRHPAPRELSGPLAIATPRDPVEYAVLIEYLSEHPEEAE